MLIAAFILTVIAGVVLTIQYNDLRAKYQAKRMIMPEVFFLFEDVDASEWKKLVNGAKPANGAKIAIGVVMPYVGTGQEVTLPELGKLPQIDQTITMPSDLKRRK